MVLFFIALCVLIIIFNLIRISKNIDGEGDIVSIILASFFLFFNFLIFLHSIYFANETKASLATMLPDKAVEAKINTMKINLNNIQLLIKEAALKNKFQVNSVDLKGLKIMSSPMSYTGISLQGLGDIERGGAEKLRIFSQLIEEQYQYAEKIATLEFQLYRPEWYDLKKTLLQQENNIYTGLAVRLFSIDSDVIENSKQVSRLIYKGV